MRVWARETLTTWVSFNIEEDDLAKHLPREEALLRAAEERYETYGTDDQGDIVEGSIDWSHIEVEE